MDTLILINYRIPKAFFIFFKCNCLTRANVCTHFATRAHGIFNNSIQMVYSPFPSNYVKSTVSGSYLSRQLQLSVEIFLISSFDKLKSKTSIFSTRCSSFVVLMTGITFLSMCHLMITWAMVLLWYAAISLNTELSLILRSILPVGVYAIIWMLFCRQ